MDNENTNKVKLVEEIQELNTLLKRRISIKYVFFLGIVRGVGTVIGATLVGGLILGFIASNIDRLNEIPIVENFINAERVQEVIEEGQ
jgi:hypothetical protein